MGVRQGERILEIGCGTGVLDRWLARRTNGQNPIVAVDINRYLLGEAASLARKEGLDGLIEFREGSAEALPLADSSFDVTMAVTVLEEGDARRMLAEMVRVTKPGGRVGVVVRGDVDMPSWFNLPLRPELKLRLEAPGRGGGKAEAGVADAGLYRLFQESGLLDVEMFPQLGAIQPGPFLTRGEAARRAMLSAEEIPEWQAAVATAEKEGTYFVANPLHCAVGTKPS
jgi:SAM-dependent methyltransferase